MCITRIKNIFKFFITLILHADFWVITGLLAFTLFNRYPLLSYLKTHNYSAVSYIYSWILLWNCKCIETFDFSMYWASNAMYPYDNALAFSETLIGLTPFGCPLWISTHNPVLTINILSLLLIWFTAISAYLVIKKMIGGTLPALAGTIIFAFYPWTLREFTVGRPHMLAFLWLPLIFYGNWKYWQEEKWKHWSLIVFFWLWSFLISLYTGIFLTVVLVFWNIIWSLKENNLFSFRKIVKWCIGVAIVWLLVCPLFYKYYIAGKNLGATRTMEQQLQLTGPVWSWFVIPEENWLWAQKITLLPASSLHVTQLENAMFPGFAAFALLIISFFIRKMPPWLSSLKWTALITAILAIGPYTLGISLKIPMPFYALWYLFPPMKATRNPHRFSIFVILIIGILAAYILQRIPKKRIISTVLKICLILLICVEVWTYVVPHESLNPDSIAIYKKLPQQKTPHVLIEMPTCILPEQTRALFISTYHWNTIINGVTGVWPPVQFQLATELHEFPSSHSIKLLQALDVEYIIIHNEKFTSAEPQHIHALLQQRKETQWIGNSGSVHLWKLQAGELRLSLNPQEDLAVIGPSQLVEGKANLGLEITPAKNRIVFNPKASVRFAFHSSRPWYISTHSGGQETYRESSWYAPGLFHQRNNNKIIPVLVSSGVPQINISVDVMGEKITFKKFYRVLPVEKTLHPLPPYLNLPKGFKTIPWKDVHVKFDVQSIKNDDFQPGDQLEGTITVINPGPFYWYANKISGIWLGLNLKCNNAVSRFEYTLPHDLFPGDSASIYIHAPLPPYNNKCTLQINCFGRTPATHYRWFPESNAYEFTVPQKK